MKHADRILKLTIAGMVFGFSAVAVAADEPLTTLLSEDFENGPGPFAFEKPVFGYTSEDYSTGEHQDTGGYNESGGLQVELGGVDGDDGEDMSGGWAASFETATDTTVTVSLRYRLQFSVCYEPEEKAQVLASVDGEPVGPGPDNVLYELEGSESQCPDPIEYDDSGWQQTSFDVDVEAGMHELVIGVWNNAATSENEIAKAHFDDVRVSLQSVDRAEVGNLAQDGARQVFCEALKAYCDPKPRAAQPTQLPDQEMPILRTGGFTEAFCDAAEESCQDSEG